MKPSPPCLDCVYNRLDCCYFFEDRPYRIVDNKPYKFVCPLDMTKTLTKKCRKVWDNRAGRDMPGRGKK